MFNIDRKYLYIILGILVVFSLANYINNPTELLTLLLTLPGVIIAITFHEFAHAWTAYKLGDNTPKMQGRVNLNPLSHIDPFGFAMLVFVHIGWGKPVEINPRNFNRKKSMSAQEALVAFAGPAMNLIIAIILTVISFCLLKFAPAFVLFNRVGIIISTMLEMAIVVNIGLGIFNLVPLPPLDGSKILMHFLPYNARNWFVSNQNIFYIVFLVIWITGAVGYIISPIINAVYIGLYSAIGWIFGLF
ncbi:MAG: site-2 protease family protein [Clostridia bacterium]